MQNVDAYQCSTTYTFWTIHHRLVLIINLGTTYLKTFLSVFIILMLIFVLQAIWLYISELAGKDLDIDVVFKFLLYVTPTLIPLILPLTIFLMLLVYLVF